MSHLHLLKQRTAWTTAIYLSDDLSISTAREPSFLLRPTKKFRNPAHPHTISDPFLFSRDGRTYVFYETQVADEFGVIEAAALTSDGLEQLGTVLSEPFHLSYPAIFEFGGLVYMLPETAEAGELRLYRFADFPRRPTFLRKIAEGCFKDPSPFVVNGTLFLFVTTSDGLQLYFMDDPDNDCLHIHPASPITRDPALARCGGTPFWLNRMLLRPAQNCVEHYGANLSLMRIEEVNKKSYRESLFRRDIFDRKSDWNTEGGHHLSVAQVKQGHALAIDGQATDSDINRVLSRLWMIGNNRRRR